MLGVRRKRATETDGDAALERFIAIPRCGACRLDQPGGRLHDPPRHLRPEPLKAPVWNQTAGTCGDGAAATQSKNSLAATMAQRISLTTASPKRGSTSAVNASERSRSRRYRRFRYPRPVRTPGAHLHPLRRVRFSPLRSRPRAVIR